MKKHMRIVGLLAGAAMLLSACGVEATPTTTTTNTGSATATSGTGATSTTANGAAPTIDVGSVAGAAKGKKICFAFQDLETEFWVAGHESIIRELNKLGAEVIERNAHQDANKQLEQVKDCISQKVDGIIIIPQDGDSAVTIIGEANKAQVPIAVFNRPPSPNNPNSAIVVVANNESISKQAVEYMADQAKKKQVKLGRKVQPLIMVGDLGDPNAVARKKGFDEVIAANPDVFEKPIEVATKWDAATGLAGLQNAMQATPDVDLLFTSSDFLYPQIRQVLEPLGKWKKVGDDAHVILGGVDGDSTACGLMHDGYVDATGVQNLFYESQLTLQGLLKAIGDKNGTPKEQLDDPGFALTQANLSTKANDMWGCVIPPPKK